VPKDLQGLATYATSTRTATDQLQQHLSELKPSAADAPKVSRYLAALKQGNAILGEISTAAAAGQKSTVSVLGKKLSATNAGALAVDAGLTSCATSS
jgi:CHASE3 domain sensor protein